MPSKIAVLHLVPGWGSTYSLNTAIREQVIALSRARNLEVALLAPKPLKRPDWLPKTVTFLPVVPRFSGPPDFFKSRRPTEKLRVANALAKHLKPYEAVLVHDLIVLKQFEYARDILKKVAKKYPHLIWYQFIHAFIRRHNDKHRFRFPNSRYVCLSKSLAKYASEAIRIKPKKIKVFPNLISAQSSLSLPHAIASLPILDELLRADFSAIHPFSLCRWVNKQPYQLLLVMASLTRFGYSTYVFFTDFLGKWSPTENLQFKLRLRWLAGELGLTHDSLGFASDLTEKFQGFTHPEVNSLFRLTNLFIHPSTSEACPLVAIEAAANSNLCVVNAKVPSFKDILGKNAIFFEFKRFTEDDQGQAFKKLLTYYQRYRRKYDELAERILRESQTNPLMGAKRRYFEIYCREVNTQRLAQFFLSGNQKRNPAIVSLA